MILPILIFGLLLRVISLNQSLWLDEATTALVAKMSTVDIFTKFLPNDFHPPLYYVLIKYWSIIFSNSEIALRIPSVVFGILTIYFVFLIAKELKMKHPWLPALFLATSGLHVYYSQETRMYSLAAFLVAVVVYLFLKKSWMLFSIILVLLFLTDYLSILILPAILVYSFLRKKEVRNVLLSCIPLGVTFFIWLPTFSHQILNGISVKTNLSSWWNILGTVNFKNLALIPTKFIIGKITLDNKSIYYLLVFYLIIVFGYVIIRARNKLLWSWFGISLILGIVISFFIPTLTYFRYLFILPAFYLLLSEKISKKIILIILIINLFSTGVYLINSRFHRENWKEVAKLIGNEKIVFPVNSQKEALTYYGKNKQIIAKEELTSKDQEIWLSRYVWDIFDPTDLTRKYIESLGYNKVVETNLNGVILIKYARSN